LISPQAPHPLRLAEPEALVLSIRQSFETAPLQFVQALVSHGREVMMKLLDLCIGHFGLSWWLLFAANE
jgi:hypothetical protein